MKIQDSSATHATNVTINPGVENVIATSPVQTVGTVARIFFTASQSASGCSDNLALRQGNGTAGTLLVLTNNFNVPGALMWIDESPVSQYTITMTASCTDTVDGFLSVDQLEPKD